MYNSILKTFVYVAEEGSFNKAASLLYISSVAVKKQMDQLEKQLGITLFNKTNAGTTLNDAGKELYDFTKKYIEESDNEIFYLKDKYSSNILNINIANPLIEDNSIKKIIFSKIKNMKYNIKINPYIPFNNKEEKIIDILNEDNDFIIAAYSKSINSKLEFVPIKKFKMTCVVFKDDKLSKKKALNLENLNNKNIYLWRNDIYQVSDDIRRDLINPDLNVHIYNRDSINIDKILLNFDKNKDIIIIEDAWSQFNSDFLLIPLNNYHITFGLYYLKKNFNKLKEFINELK